MAILTGPEIKEQIEEGNIDIDPYHSEHVRINSVDLTLSNHLKVYVDNQGVPIGKVYQKVWSKYPKSPKKRKKELYQRGAMINVQDELNTKEYNIPDDGMILEPGIGYLGSTQEYVSTDKFVPSIDGRSSVGRLFLQVHATAGRGDIGFHGTWTLEMDCLHPVKIKPGMRICQITFAESKGDIELYDQKDSSKYQGQYMPTESKIHEDFEEYDE